MTGLDSFDAGNEQPNDSDACCSEPTNERQSALTSGDLDYELARRAFSQGDFQHAAFHIAVALAGNPRRTEWIAFLDHLIDESSGELLPLKTSDQRRSYAEEAVRAYFFARKGKINEAAVSLYMVSLAKPDVDYIGAWLLRWMDERALKELREENLLLLANVIMNRFPEYEGASASQLHELSGIHEMFDKYATLHPDTEPAVTYALTTMLRKRGLYDEAVEVSRRLISRNACFGHLAMAMALRGADRYDEAIVCFRSALNERKSETAIMLDIGDTLLQEQRIGDALSWYEKALELAPDSDWALASVYYCRARVTGNAQWSQALLKLARNGNGRALELQRLMASPWYGYLPEPDDATANGLRSIIEASEKGEIEHSPVKMSLSQIEAPSCLLALELQLRSMNMCISELTVSNIQQPDPRRPKGEVKHILWRYEDTVAIPVPKAPCEEVTALIRRMSITPFDYWRSWRQARLTADKLSRIHVDDLLGIMVHPPEMPDGVNSLQWIPRVQLAAAQVIANLDREWKGGFHKEVLFDLAKGPVDWSVEAAIIALTQLCLVFKEPVEDVLELFAFILDHTPRNNFCCYTLALLYNWAMLPISPEDRRGIYLLIEELENESSDL